MRKTSHYLLSFFLAVTLWSCTESDGSKRPSLKIAATDNWCNNDTHAFLATVEGNDAMVDDVELLVARHHWPDDVADAHVIEPATTAGKAYTFQIPDELKITSGQRLIYRLRVRYKESETSATSEKLSDHDTISLCCNYKDFDTFLREDQVVVCERFESFDSGWPGFPGEKFGDGEYKYQAAHGKCCYADMGVALARVEDQEKLIWGYPNVLLYAPDPDTNPDDLCDLSKDFPYTLIGWAYAIPYEPGNPPQEKCFPFHEWFVHEAGFHYLNSGKFCLTPPNENFPGELAVTDQSQAEVDCSGTCSGCPRKWHERLWDFHIWRNDGGTPTYGIFHPDGAPEGCMATLPDGTFFKPQLEI